MIANAEKILQRAQAGEKVSTKERRHALSYLLLGGRGPVETNAVVGELFKVSERQIRLDKVWLREQRARSVREDDPGLVIADIVMSFEKEVRDMERSKNKAKLGTRAYLEHCRSIFKAQLDKVKAMQELGWLPRNLGSLSVTKYEYKAVVGKDGSVEVRPIELILDAEEIEAVEVKALPAPDANRDTTEFDKDL